MCHTSALRNHAFGFIKNIYFFISIIGTVKISSKRNKNVTLIKTSEPCQILRFSVRKKQYVEDISDRDNGTSNLQPVYACSKRAQMIVPTQM